MDIFIAQGSSLLERRGVFYLCSAFLQLAIFSHCNHLLQEMAANNYIHATRSTLLPLCYRVPVAEFDTLVGRAIAIDKDRHLNIKVTRPLLI
jgi:hypothetical protein